MHNQQRTSHLVNMLDDDFNQDDSPGNYQSVNEADKKATHSEIEKRRRQKMNKYLNELVQYLPGSSNRSKKLDKISILKTAVNHMKNLKASSSILSDSFICQNFITALELQSLILKDSDDFLIVIKCDSGKILYVSDSCQKSIGIPSAELTDRVFFELVHPSDTKQVKDQLVYADRSHSSQSGQSLIFNQYKNLNTGVRRSFNCRIKLGFPRTYGDNENQRDAPMEIRKPEYKVVSFNGYLRSDVLKNVGKSGTYSPNDSAKLSRGGVPAKIAKLSSNDGNGQVTQYLIAYGHSKQKATTLINFEYVSRLDIDGKFIYVESGVNLLLGYLPHQLLAESLFNHAHPDDVPMLRKAFQDALNNPHQKVFTQPYRVKLENSVKADSYVTVETVFYALANPSSCQLEYVLAQNRLSNVADISSTALGILSSSRANSTISMPMTPSPEEISYSNNDSLSEKASPIKATPISHHHMQHNTIPSHQPASMPYKPNRINQMENAGYNMANPEFYTAGEGQPQASSHFNATRKADFAQPNKHTAPFSNSYEYVQLEHAYSVGEPMNVSINAADPSSQYNNISQMQYSQKAGGFPIPDAAYMSYSDNPYAAGSANALNK